MTLEYGDREKCYSCSSKAPVDEEVEATSNLVASGE